MTTPLPVLEDRVCRAGALSNPLRRWLAPASRELDLLSPAEGETVADLGAGVGYFAEAILCRIGRSGRLLLVDIDPENLDLARRRLTGDPRVRFEVASAARVDHIASESVDRVLLSLVLCCLVEKEAAMDETWRILRPGGQVLITYPRRRAPWRRGPSLRVTPERWIRLAARRPWTTVADRPGWLLARHLLRRPPAEVARLPRVA